METRILLKIPWPPSVNHYYDNAQRRTRTGKTYMARKLSNRAIAYHTEVFALAKEAKIDGFGGANVSMSLEFYPPDNRVRDADNTLKAIQDSLVKAFVLNDDRQIKEGHWRWNHKDKPGYVLVTLEVL